MKLETRNSKPETENSRLETPKSLGYHMPAEWEPHEATWFSWPKDPDTFPAEIIDDVENIYCETIKTIQKSEKVKILVNDDGWKNKVKKKLENHNLTEKNIVFHNIKSIDVWTRDYAPIFVINKTQGKRAAVKWIFNSWGNKYDDLKYDNIAGEEIAKASDMEIFKPNIVLEGGSIDVNGAGTVITTEQCLLNKNRNPQFSKLQIENHLKDYLGIDNIIWLKNGIEGDDTDGHVDDIARFVSENKILCVVEENKKDRNHHVLKENFNILKKTGFDIIELPMPGKLSVTGRRLPASYSNFYIANDAVLIPVFNDKNDEKAIGILKDCFPGREIVGINSKNLVYGYGGIHCVTMQEPFLI